MRTGSFRSQCEPRFAVDALPTVLPFTHHVLVREHVGFAFLALEVPERVIFTGIGLDDFEVIVAAVSAGVFHAL